MHCKFVKESECVREIDCVNNNAILISFSTFSDEWSSDRSALGLRSTFQQR